MPSTKKFYIICRSSHKYSKDKSYDIVSFEVTADFKNKEIDAVENILHPLAVSKIKRSQHQSYETYAIGTVQGKDLKVKEIKIYIKHYEDNYSEAQEIASELYHQAGSSFEKLDLSNV